MDKDLWMSFVLEVRVLKQTAESLERMLIELKPKDITAEDVKAFKWRYKETET